MSEAPQGSHSECRQQLTHADFRLQTGAAFTGAAGLRARRGGNRPVATTASAEKKLPPRTPQELLVDLQQARTDGLSGTVVERADLGIPAIPGADGQDDPELTSLISGTHTLRVRYSAPDKARLAVLGTYSEYDIIRNGKDVWTWSSKDNTATHRTVTADRARQHTVRDTKNARGSRQ